MCVSCRCHFHFRCVTSTHLQADNLQRLVNWRCRFSNCRPDLVTTIVGAEPRLDKQYPGPSQEELVITQWEADGILREVTELKTVLASLQVDTLSVSRKLNSCQRTKPLKLLNIGQFIATAQFSGTQGA